MKRGNTALKRGVGLASAFALAIAGAVVAAPAASAWPAGYATTAPTNLIRQTPTADSNWVNADGTVADTVQTTQAYNLTGGTERPTGVANNFVPGVNYQAAGDLQILLPVSATGGPAWSTGDTLTVSLDDAGGAVTFAQAPSSVSLSSKPIVTADLATRAGFTGTHATSASVDSTATAPTTAFHVGAALVTGDKTQLVLTLPNPAGAGGGLTSGTAYLLSIGNVRLNVAADTAADGAVTATVTGTDADGTTDWAADGGTTTLGYVNTLKVTASGAPKVSGTTVTLPPVVVTEATKDAFNSTGGISFDIEVNGTKAGTAAVGFDSAATVTVATNAKLGTTAGTATPITTGDYSGTDDEVVTSGINGNSNANAIESIAITGLKVLNVKPGTDVTVTLTASGTAANYSTGTTTSTFSFAPSQSGGESATVAGVAPESRIAGANRYETAADIAAKVGATDSVIIANGENAKQGVDALSANFLAGVEGAPILLTQAGSLPNETKGALTDLFKGSIANITIYVMGKSDSVSNAVRDAAKAAVVATANPVATVTVKEVAGEDRYQTSVKSAETADWASVGTYDLGKGNLRTAFLASGQVNADALAAGAVSAGSQIPVLLTTNGDALPTAVSDAISNQHIGQVIILGNTDRVSQKVEDALTTAGVNVVRLAGTDRFDTAVKIATLDRKAATDGTGQATGNTVFLANGVDGWPDALASGPYVGGLADSLLTVSSSDALPSSTKSFISTYKTTAPKLTDVMGLGGTDRVTNAAITAAKDLLK